VAGADRSRAKWDADLIAGRKKPSHYREDAAGARSMPFVTRTVLGLLAWLAVRAGSNFDFPAAIPAAMEPDNMVRPNRAGRLVPVPDAPETGRSLLAHSALWAAVGVIVLILAAGYVRRRWKSGRRIPSPVSGRDGPRK
jgi:hypothetical protein